MTYWDMSKGRRITRNGLMKNAINCWCKKNKTYQAYFSQTDKDKKRAEYEKKRKLAHTACNKKNRQVINQQLIAVEQEFKEKSQRQNGKKGKRRIQT